MIIGLTGKTGSGKSSAAKIFEALGAYVVDCDKIGHEILSDENVRKQLLNEFSDVILSSDGTIDRKILGSIVFSDEDRLLALNRIMHKAISDKALAMCCESGKDICIIDGSEIEASGLYKHCAYVVVITAEADLRLSRILNRDKINRKSALMRMNSQKDYSREAFFVANNGDFDTLKAELTQLYNKFIGDINDSE